MIEKSGLASKIFSLLKGNNLPIKIYDEQGAETTDPSLGCRFFVLSPNIMVTIDEDSNSVEFSKGKSVDDSILPLQKNIRKLADEFLMNSAVKVFGKSIQPRDYAYQAKMQKDQAVMEKSIVENDFGTVNSHLLGEIVKMIKRFTSKNHQKPGMPNGAAFHDICSNLGSDPEDVQPVLNRLVQSGKVTAQPYKGYVIYSMSVDEAITEAPDNSKYNSQLKQVMKRNAVTGQDNRDLTGYTAGNKHGQKDVPHVSRFAFPDKSPANVQKKKMTPFESITESFSKMFGTKTTSKQTLENVRIMVRHKQPVDENVRGSRSRHISAIFLECNGERFRLPFTNLQGARAMAQHVAHGGNVYDKVSEHIKESVSNLGKLQSFTRYVTSNKLINEDSSGIVETVKENIEGIRTDLKRLAGTKTYETTKARIETFNKETLEESDTEELKELFTIRRFDEKFDEVLPIVEQLIRAKDTFHKRIEEAASGVVIIRRETIDTTPIFEFTSEHAKLGFKLNEFSLRIVENDELAGFIGKVSTKICKEGILNEFERAVISQVLENVEVEKEAEKEAKDLTESTRYEQFLDKYTYTFI